MMNQRPGAEEEEVEEEEKEVHETTLPPADVGFVMIMLVVSPRFYDR